MPDESELDKKNQSRRLEKRLNERFVKAMATYRLIEDDDKILVGLSGGKDSLLLTELLAKRARIQHPRFSIEAIHVRMENIRYETDTSYLEQFCADLGIRLHIVTTRFDTAASALSDASSATVPVSDVSSATVQYTAQDAQSAAHSPASILRRQKQPCFLCSWN